MAKQPSPLLLLILLQQYPNTASERSNCDRSSCKDSVDRAAMVMFHCRGHRRQHHHCNNNCNNYYQGHDSNNTKSTVAAILRYSTSTTTADDDYFGNSKGRAKRQPTDSVSHSTQAAATATTPVTSTQNSSNSSSYSNSSRNSCIGVTATSALVRNILAAET